MACLAAVEPKTSVNNVQRGTVRAMSSAYAIAGLGTPELLIIVIVLGLLFAVFAGLTSALVWLIRRR